MQLPVKLLKEGTDTSQGIPQIVSNINACQVIGEAIKEYGKDDFCDILNRLIIKNLESKCSQETELFLMSICSIGILSRNKVFCPIYKDHSRSPWSR